METEIKEWRTKDMNLAACLMVESRRFLRIERDGENSRRLVFVFEDHPEIERIQTDRANGSHIVSSTNYDDALRRVKTLIHSVI